MKKIFWLPLIAIFTFVGCGTTTSITHSWKADNVGPQRFNKIVVLGLVKDQAFRETMEKHIVGDLHEAGFTATCSCDEYNPKAFEGMTETQAVEKLRSMGVDAVLTIVLLDKQKERYYVPGRVYYSPYYVSHNHFWQYYSNMYYRVNTEGYYVTNTRYFWESNLYDLKMDRLLYST